MRKFIAMLMISSFSIFGAEAFTKADRSFLAEYIGEEDEFEDDDAKKIVKYLEDKYEGLLKDEVHKKVALEAMQNIEKYKDLAKKQLKEENFNDAGTWALIGLIWVQAIDPKHQELQWENYYKQVQKTK